jgi:hypothetical protein
MGFTALIRSAKNFFSLFLATPAHQLRFKLAVGFLGRGKPFFAKRFKLGISNPIAKTYVHVFLR